MPPDSPPPPPEPEITLEEWIAATQSCCGVDRHDDADDGKPPEAGGYNAGTDPGVPRDGPDPAL